MTFAKSILFLFISFHFVYGFWNSGRRVDRVDTISKIYTEKNSVKDSTTDYNSIQISAQFAKFNRFQGSLFLPQRGYLTTYNKSLAEMSGPEISIAWMRSRYMGYKLVFDYAMSKEEISGYFGDLYTPYPYNSVSNDISLYSFGPGMVFSLPISKNLTFNWELICQLLYWHHRLNVGFSLYELSSAAASFSGWTIGVFPRMRCDYYLSPNWSLTLLTGFQIANIHDFKFNVVNYNTNRMEPLSSFFYSFGLIHNIRHYKPAHSK